MGDVHPHPAKAALVRELSRITFERWSKDRKRTRPAAVTTGKSILCNSGFEAVEAALKTACLATGKPGVIAFERGYHGLGYGALATTHRPFFRDPFRRQLGRFGHFAEYPCATADTPEPTLERLRQHLDGIASRHAIGAVLVEPVQGRGGIRVPPSTFLPRLREWCDSHQVLLVVDEIFTGFGRTGRWFAVEHTRTIPDIICLGKALTGGFPLSACVGRADIMDAWPESEGEALHTSTFLGNPVGCAMALAQIRELRRGGLAERSAELGTDLLEALGRIESPQGWRLATRGLGLMAGLEVRRENGKPGSDLVWAVVLGMLRRGYILLPEGDAGEVLSLTPPLIISRAQLSRALKVLSQTIREEAAR
jgi:4-aminobutyrate aminotransferase-like enzyme